MFGFSPNQSASANPAITLLFQAEHHWRGVAEPDRWAALNVCTLDQVKR